MTKKKKKQENDTRETVKSPPTHMSLKFVVFRSTTVSELLNL
jgi:hypothetical protein